MYFVNNLCTREFNLVLGVEILTKDYLFYTLYTVIYTLKNRCSFAKS